MCACYVRVWTHIWYRGIYCSVYTSMLCQFVIMYLMHMATMIDLKQQHVFWWKHFTCSNALSYYSRTDTINYSMLVWSVVPFLLIDCQCVTFQGTEQKRSGIFHSPDYPRPYRNNINCILYIFIAPPNRKSLVEVIFDDLDLGEVNRYGK